VLRSGAEASSVTFTRRRTGGVAPPGDGRAQGRRGQADKRWLPPDLPGELLLWQKVEGLADGVLLFASRKRGAGGSVRVIGRVQAWWIVKEASARAQVRVLALRESKDGQAEAPPRT
jgi:hypothetical protein